MLTIPQLSSRHWSRTDSLLIVACTGLAAALRVAGLARPRGFVFDEFYASDACLYAFGPQKFCRATTEISVVHPPLGKWLIATGLEVFGFNPLGWRAAAVIAGTLSVAVVYLLARRWISSSSSSGWCRFCACCTTVIGASSLSGRGACVTALWSDGG
jgi:4-amino-4-deoxy-L-arabinose transferase-like glycosyltransferase